MSLTAGLVLAVLSTAALSCGFYIQHSAAGTLPELSVRHPLVSLADLFRNLRWLVGFTTGIGGWALYIVALAFAPLSLVQAVSAGGVGLIALLARLGGERLSRLDRLGVVAAVGGLLLLALSLPAGAAHHSAARSWAEPAGWILASVVLAGLAAGLPGRLRKSGAGLAVAAGLLYSAGDVSTKAALDGTHPVYLFALLLPACHGLAFVALQLSFQRGTVLATAGVAALLTNALPIAAGVIVFAEHLPAGVPGLVRGLGFAGAVLGAALLAGTGRDRPLPQGDRSGRSDHGDRSALRR